MQKQELRKEIRERKRQFTERQLRELSLPAIRKLLNHARVKEADVVMVYYSLPDEIYTHELVDELVRLGKTVLLPKMIDDRNIEARVYKGKEDLQQGHSFHILEPAGECFRAMEDIDTIVVPGMSFDKEGNRLGRGKGYYDRFLSQLKHAYKIGVCFDFQCVKEVPTDENDIKMDEVIDNGMQP